MSRAVTNPREVPGAHAIIRRLCALQAHVATEVIGHCHPADCFCGDEGFWPLESADDYRNDGEAAAFIEDAVLKAVGRVKRMETALIRVLALLDPLILAADEDTAITEARRTVRAALEASE